MEWPWAFVEVALIVVLLNDQRTRDLQRDVARLDRKLNLILKYLNLDLGQGSGLSERVIELALSGQKIQAIKAYREETGAGLADAKNAVEDWARSNQR